MHLLPAECCMKNRLPQGTSRFAGRPVCVSTHITAPHALCISLRLHGCQQLWQWHLVPLSPVRPQRPHLWSRSCTDKVLARCTPTCGCLIVKYHAEKREGLELPRETACGMASTLWMSAGNACGLTCLRSWLS